MKLLPRWKLYLYFFLTFVAGFWIGRIVEAIAVTQ